MEDILLKIGEFFHSDLIIANVGMIAMAVTYLINTAVTAWKNKKTVKIKIDNEETNKRFDELEKENAELKEGLTIIGALLMLMIRHSKLSDEAKVKAEDILEGKKVDTTKVETPIESNEPAKTVVEKLSNELNK